MTGIPAVSTIPTLYLKLVGGLAGLLALAGIYAWHNHAVSSAYDRGKADEAEHIKAKALELKNATDALTSNISSLIRSTTDAENNRIHSSAGAIILRGPGRASCSSNAGLPATPGGHGAPGGTVTAQLPKVPYPDGEQLLGVPFSPAIRGAEVADMNRQEVLSWREWWKRENEAWPKPPPAKPKHKFLGIL